ncbi:MAG: hypothetical protein EOM24_09720, partial [Chloroflexia bacterium]|nr:hypothetical protein [Chloroflexia bacterium]
LSGTVAYVGEGMALVALDVSNPAQPIRRSHLLQPATIRDVQVISATAYLANDEHGLRIVDVRQPDAMVALGGAPTPDAALSIAEPSTIDPTTQTITAHPRHFSTWAVLGQTLRMYVPLMVR